MKRQVSVNLSEPKYRALGYYLEKDGSSIEEELKRKLDELYRDIVPKDVRDKIKDQTPEDETEIDQTQKTDAPKQSGPVLSM